MRHIKIASKFPPLESINAASFPEMAREVYGDRIHVNSSMTAFAYLFRRFGPPPMGSDDYKEIAAWVLTTTDPEIYFKLYPGGCEIDLYMSYFATKPLAAAAEKPLMDHFAATRSFCKERGLDYDAEWDSEAPAWKGIIERPPWRDPAVEKRVRAVLAHFLLEMLRPVFIRDVPINLFGRETPTNSMRGREAKRSPLAGWGIPHKPIADRIAADAKGSP